MRPFVIPPEECSVSTGVWLPDRAFTPCMYGKWAEKPGGFWNGSSTHTHMQSYHTHTAYFPWCFLPSNFHFSTYLGVVGRNRRVGFSGRSIDMCFRNGGLSGWRLLAGVLLLFLVISMWFLQKIFLQKCKTWFWQKNPVTCAKMEWNVNMAEPFV